MNKKRTHNIPRAALTLLMTLAMALSASATVTDFITDVMVIGHDDQTAFNNLQTSLVNQGWTAINKDLNAGCGSGSAYIHLLYKTLDSEGSSGFPITDFYIKTGENPPDSLTHEGRTYHLVPCDGSTSFVNGHGDLNAGCGSNSAYIYLYYTKDILTNHHSVTTITFNDVQSGGVGANGGSTGYDLNTGCGAGTPYIYMHVATQLPAGTTAPQRNLDFCTGGSYSIHVGGWTFDPDAPWASLDVHVYVYTDASCSSQSQYGQIHILHTNVPRPDVNSAYSIVGNHGFDETIPIADAGNYWVKVWAINYNGGSNPQIGTTTAVTVIPVVTLTPSTGEVLLHDGDTLTGTGGGNTRVSIADGATVTLSGATITSIPNDVNHQWSGLTCLGDAIIVLAEGTTNAMTGGAYSPGLYVPQGHTLTIQGSGTLNARGKSYAAGIGSSGGGYGGSVPSCGNITISGGSVTAQGGDYAAGIGSGDFESSCGNITINGGTVNATGGTYAPGIGSSGISSSCGNITITNGVTRVTATKGNSCYNSIGAGNSSTCGTITIGGVVTGNISQSPFVTFPYTVAFNANGGSGTMSDQGFMYNVAQNLNANSFNNFGHFFDGWATSAEGPKVYNNGQSVNNLADTIATVPLYAKWGNPTFTLDIEGYGDASNPGGWYLIASPVAQAIAPSADNGFITSEYDLYAFDHDYVGEQWRNYETDNFLLTNGMGYLYASELATTLTFTGTPYNGSGEWELAYNPDVSVFNGWNLVGNPYAQTASVDRDFYVMNGDRSEVIAAEGSTVEPMEGLFVVAEGADETVTFTKNTRETRHEERIVINLSRPSTGSGTGSSGVIDRAIVRFGDPSTSSGTGKPLPKFQMNPSHTKVYIPQDGKDYAIANATDMDEMPVNFKAEHNGTYTLTFSIDNVDFDYLHLIDNLTGADVDLLVPNGGDAINRVSTYTFEAKTTDYESRFKLVFNTNEDGPSTGSGAFAFYSNGNWIIANEGKATLQVIDMNGRILSSETINGRASINVKGAAGVYMIRLISGENVRVQKVIVK